MDLADVAVEEKLARSVDLFHRGRFSAVQARDGHRSGLDAMLVAAAVPAGFSGLCADLGAGCGAAGFAVASRCPEARVLLVERDGEMAACADAALELDVNAHLAARASVLRADVTLRGAARRLAGLAESSVDFVIMNPPFNAASDRASPDLRRREAHVLEAGLMEDWLRTAGAMLRDRGGLAVIARPESMDELLAAAHRRFGGLRITPVHPRPGSDAIRMIVTGVRGSRKRLAIAPSLVLHGETGHGFTPRAERLINGETALGDD